ncbi:hypothetical protein [Jiulongibacter sp. NS-SX5]|uniref:hypothetical protein n=1 Tax=Jiulongibacter sp. NS-SX5 TaxID=3463854 RepID=UPI0040584EB6
MKSLWLLIFPLLFSSCKEKDCCVFPEGSELHGEWELVKIVNGFAQIELTGEEIGYTETLKIDAGRDKITFDKSDSPKETFSFELREELSYDAIVLEEADEYHWYWLNYEDGKEELTLYQRSRVGAVLADGSYYHYLKR